MRDPAELKELFRKVLGTDWVTISLFDGGHFSVQAREVGTLDSDTLEDIESNNIFIERFWFDVAGGGTFVAHCLDEKQGRQ